MTGRIEGQCEPFAVSARGVAFMVVPSRRMVDYLKAVGLVVLATLIRWPLNSLMGERGPFLTYFAAVGLASWIGGAGPGLVALILGGLGADFFFMPPLGSLGITKIESQLGLGMYFFVGLVLVSLAESQRRARNAAERSARQALERQAQLEQEIKLRQQVEREREALLAEQAKLRVVAEEQAATVDSLFDQSPIGIVLLDANLRYLKVNSQAASLVRRTPEEMIGRGIGEILGDSVPQSRIKELDHLFRHTLETGEPFGFKGYSTGLPGPNGSTVHVDWNLKRIQSNRGGTLGVLGTYIDVTDEVEQARALRKSEELFRLAADAVDGLIYDADMVSGRVDRTRGMFQLVGYHP